MQGAERRPRIATSVRQKPDGSPIFKERRYMNGGTEVRVGRPKDQIRYLNETAIGENGKEIKGVDAIKINDKDKGFQG